jgi:hypothetical protein
MRKTIFKYNLKLVYEQTVDLPKGAEILGVKSQFDFPVLYALVDTDETKTDKRIIEIFRTGFEFSEAKRKYISTIMIDSDHYVFHFFEKL